MRPYATASLPGFAQSKTFAAFPVWAGSTTGEVKFSSMSRKQGTKLYFAAKRWESATRGHVLNARGRISLRDGAIGRAGLAVLHALIFEFLNERSGRLDPSYQAIAAKACYSVRTVARALARLKARGVLNWVRRAAHYRDGDTWRLAQESNAYGIAGEGSWRGYKAPAPMPPPYADAVGKPAPVGALGLQAGDGAQRMAVVLEGAGELGQAILRLGRRRPGV